MEKLKVLKSFKDMEAGIRRLPGETFDAGSERAKQLTSFRTDIGEPIAIYCEVPAEPVKVQESPINLDEPLKSPEEVQALLDKKPEAQETPKKAEKPVKSKSQEKREAIMKEDKSEETVETKTELSEAKIEEVELDENLKPVQKKESRKYGANKAKDISGK